MYLNMVEIRQLGLIQIQTRGEVTCSIWSVTVTGQSGEGVSTGSPGTAIAITRPAFSPLVSPEPLNSIALFSGGTYLLMTLRMMLSVINLELIHLFKPLLS